MTSILDTRDELYAALAATGLEIAAGPDRMPVPGVIVNPADPWVVSAGTMARAQRVAWEIVPVAGRVDAEGSLVLLAELIERAYRVLVQLPGWTTPSITAPRTILANGTDQRCAVLGMQRLIVIDVPGIVPMTPELLEV